jgi:hypothetical protein
MAAFQRLGVDRIVLDETGNPGGNYLVGIELLARLSDRDVVAPFEQYVVTKRGEIAGFGSLPSLATLAGEADKLRSDEQVAALYASSSYVQGRLCFLPPTLASARQLAGWLRFLAGQPTPEDHSRLTEPHASVQDYYQPSGRRFGGKIVMLIDELVISAPEFVAATLKDNGLGVLFGQQTAGAGGTQRMVQRDHRCGGEPDPFTPCVTREVADDMKALGVTSFSYTVTLGVRRGADGQAREYIENIGVKPDTTYDITVDDLQHGMRGYVARVRKLLLSL